MEFKVGDYVDFLFPMAFEDNYPDFGKIISIEGDVIVCRPYRRRMFIQCNSNEIKHCKFKNKYK